MQLIEADVSLCGGDDLESNDIAATDLTVSLESTVQQLQKELRCCSRALSDAQAAREEARASREDAECSLVRRKSQIEQLQARIIFLEDELSKERRARADSEESARDPLSRIRAQEHRTACQLVERDQEAARSSPQSEDDRRVAQTNSSAWSRLSSGLSADEDDGMHQYANRRSSSRPPASPPPPLSPVGILDAFDRTSRSDRTSLPINGSHPVARGLSRLSYLSSSCEPRSPGNFSTGDGQRSRPISFVSSATSPTSITIDLQADEPGSTSLDEKSESLEVRSRGSKMLRALSSTSSSSGASTLSVMRLEAQLHAKNAEVERLRLELAGLKATVKEATEARQASESCLKALRNFVATNGPEAPTSEASTSPNVRRTSLFWGKATEPSNKQVKLPPLPTDADAEAELDEQAAARHTAGWNLRLSSLGGLSRRSPPAAEPPSGTCSSTPPANTFPDSIKDVPLSPTTTAPASTTGQLRGLGEWFSRKPASPVPETKLDTQRNGERLEVSSPDESAVPSSQPSCAIPRPLSCSAEAQADLKSDPQASVVPVL